MGALTFGRRMRSASGNAVIELAFTLPILLVVVMGIFDFGLLFQRYEVLTNAAREGARVGILPGYTTTDAVARAQQYLASGGVTTCAGCVTAVPSSQVIAGKTVKEIIVTVQYTHTFLWIGPILNLFGGSLGTVTIQGVSTMRSES